MRYRGASVRRLTLPVTGWVQRFSFALLVAASIGMLVLGRIESNFVERLRVGVTDTVAPVLEALSQPSATVAAIVEDMRSLADLHGENERLRTVNERLLQWQAVARTLEQENLAYKELLNLVDDPHPAFITARVIGDAGGAFVRTVLLNAGTDDGVRVGQAAVNAEGLVGRVVEAGRRSTRILLLTDLNSRIPVVMEKTRVPAILAGDNSDHPRLTFTPVNALFEPGERIVTSGHGGMLPPGLPVGEVVSTNSGVARVRPYVDWSALEYLRVLDFALPGILPATRTAGPAGPLP
ncbi:MAG: rod shape-determining protein MreC [Proteobacteria bacterium]|nr:rod shape-determining protein MreC [Pseudomonadota bacterium]